MVVDYPHVLDDDRIILGKILGFDKEDLILAMLDHACMNRLLDFLREEITIPKMFYEWDQVSSRRSSTEVEKLPSSSHRVFIFRFQLHDLLGRFQVSEIGSSSGSYQKMKRFLVNVDNFVREHFEDFYFASREQHEELLHKV